MKLKELREQNNLSQQDLALILKVSPSTISNWESGKRQPDIQMIVDIANYFNVSVDDVLGRTIENRVRSANQENHTLEIDEVQAIIDKIKKVDRAYLPAIETIVDGLPKKRSNH